MAQAEGSDIQVSAFGRPLDIQSVLYVTRTGNENGHVRDYEIYLSNDSRGWGAAVAKGRVSRDASDELVELPNPVNAVISSSLR